MSGDFGGYRAIVEEARAVQRANREEPITACPICGTPVDTNSRGVLNCPMGHWRSTARTHGESGGG